MAEEQKIQLNVVFQGPTFSDTYPGGQKLEQVVRSTLKAAGRAGDEPGSWELKTSAGVVLDQTIKVRDAGLSDGTTLHLVAPTGEGGC